MAGRHNRSDYLHVPRRDQLYEPHLADPYQRREKWREPTSCPDCGAVYHQGRWQWMRVPENAERHRCPACARIHDAVPAGYLLLDGDFFIEHHDELLRLVDNLAILEKRQHPLERIMDIEETENACHISFTGVHLPRAVGEAIRHAYQGQLEINHSERSDQLRVHWNR